MIKIIGIGKTGVRLLDTLISLGLREALKEEGKWRELRFIAVETDIGEWACANADAGFYLGAAGECASQAEAMERMSVRAQQALAHELRGACLILLLVETGDLLECAAAAGIAELADRAGAMAVSLVARPGSAADGAVAKADDDQLARIRAASDVVLSFHSDERELVGDACFVRHGAEPVPAGRLINCAHILLKAITQPYQQLVGCDYQDVRTVLDTQPIPEDRVMGYETAFFHRMVASSDAQPEVIANRVSECLPLEAATKVLVYLEGGPTLRVEYVGKVVRAIQSKISNGVYVKYCAEVQPFDHFFQFTMNITINAN
ncbi:MAG: hypothetical protein JSR69_17055 [Proteobacteria bacterium]|nr:hypothetical protein [Pseudomonadota bacterium]